MSILRYKGFIGSIEADPKAKVLYGKLLYINDLITYESESIAELESEFRSAVDDYLSTCKKLSRDPLKPFKGSLNIRIGPELHKELAQQAAIQNTSINDFIKMAVRHEIEDRSRQ